MRLFQVAAVGALGVMTLACGLESRPPTQSSPPTQSATEPSPDPPPQVPTGARRLEVGVTTSDALTNPPPASAGCPPVETHPYPGWTMPCRHFEVLAPGDGVLFVEVVWSPAPGAETIALIIAGVTHRPPLGAHRVLAGAAYGITVVYLPSHTEYLEYSGRVGEFSIKTTFEPRRWS